MVKLSDHTRLMNILLGLCLDVPNWPNVFRQQKYKVTLIEGNVPPSKPDIVISNNHANHSIFFDCKSKTLNPRQLENYDQIHKNPPIAINSGKINAIHKRQYHIDPSLCSFHDLSGHELVNKFSISCIQVIESDDQYCEIKEILLRRGHFTNSKLNEVFPIDTSHCVPPYHLYPFGDNDKDAFIIQILNQLHKFGYLRKEFTIEELLSGCHRMWKFIDDKSKLKKRSHSILLDLQKKGLRKYLKRNGDKWLVDISPTPQGHQAFQKRCSLIEKKLERQTYQDSFAS